MRRDLFIGAQALVYEDALVQLQSGEKKTHWMWCIFPQMNLGTSYISQLFSLTATDAIEYAADPVLGPRLRTCIHLVQDNEDSFSIFGPIDNVKLQSSMTLFWRTSGIPEAREVLDKYFNDEPCQATMKLLER